MVDRIKLMRSVTKQMEKGLLTPAEGYASLKAVASHMTEEEHRIDEACAEEALEIICKPEVE